MNSSKKKYTLADLGWNERNHTDFQRYLPMEMEPGRIAIENRDNYRVLTEYGELHAEVTGKFLYGSDEKGRFPKVGDWVALTILTEEEKALIHEILPRQTFISRKVAGNTVEEQIMATNLDFLFIVHGLDIPLNPKKIERYATMARTGGCTPVVILNKSDLIDPDAYDYSILSDIVDPDDIILSSSKNSLGLDRLKKMITAGRTFAFVGPSGVGKSSLINCLVGKETQMTYDVREKDHKGRHTTTKREMLLMPEGGILIDTPGIRELHLWEPETGLQDTFQDIYILAEQCYFSDCRHENEKGCAVVAAVGKGDIAQHRYDNYLKLNKEQAYLELKQTKQFYQNKKRRWKTISKDIKKYYKNHPKGKGRG